MLSLDRLACGQATEIQTDYGLEAGITCYDMGRRGSHLVSLSGKGAEVDDEKRCIGTITVGLIDGHQTLRYLGCESTFA